MNSQTTDLRTALGSFVSGITIITCTDEQRQPVGVTVSSFCSLSLDPPMVLWCLAKNARSASIFQSATHFAAHVLAHDQWHIAEKFATQGADKFGAVSWSPGKNGLPLLDDCTARFECARRAVHDGGDHWILTGLIENFAAWDIAPLAYHRGRYALTHRGEHAEQLISLQSW
jgi:3-hydroxy-9,10-secoandrosta-1,3,5(10)-triene-9,17-dione monooxygenase reductase component